ncbi:TAXI family TRAP transporter solute-binding subunit [Geomonas sp. Red69]|uniref:TAXI family TRAP transporter solute-binding subunit n=1 Tax=Geomonas diazotrophica TaxID=2843197 RepID=A0ABX8JSI2_9BACT|nr:MULTISPECIES: TAXI family TRAP transporter solute-binding subunit [Geomonas]MBU5637274.1 TAXI family TRAP transporter solute-binding subunit [Geomonas diazotrophica]QWV99564.1 TAXI family TRAP transporter solute-binding subunit [Geomonas nitrogeniifigens]QXE88739.1 TAXI family TRAP transporter solute-binding subunit [Geomonas nitrogeniifigens]
MHFSRQVARLVLLAAAAALLFPVPRALCGTVKPLSISSGTTTSSYYAAASAVAKIFNKKSAVYGMRLATVASAGSVANIDAVAEGRAAFGIAETELLKRAMQGVRPWEGKARGGLRAVLGLYPATVTIVAAVDSGIKRVSDLKGKRLNIGAPGSIDNTYASALLQMSGLNPGEVINTEHSTAIAPELLQKGDIDAYLCIVGHPNLTVLEASAGQRKVLLVPLDEGLIRQVTANNPLLAPVLIPTRFYPNVQTAGAVQSLGVRTVLFTTADQSDESVYHVVREILGNLDLFRRQHPIFQDLTPEQAARVTAIPLHPGAARYFKESGLIP